MWPSVWMRGSVTYACEAEVRMWCWGTHAMLRYACNAEVRMKCSGTHERWGTHVMLRYACNVEVRMQCWGTQAMLRCTCNAEVRMQCWGTYPTVRYVNNTARFFRPLFLQPILHLDLTEPCLITDSKLICLVEYCGYHLINATDISVFIYFSIWVWVIHLLYASAAPREHG